MFITVRLMFRNYKPFQLEKGMLFLIDTPNGKMVFENAHTNIDVDTYAAVYGYPVKPMLVYEGNPNVPGETFILAQDEQIGWFDDGDHSDELHDISLKEINNILMYDGGMCQVEIETIDEDEDSYEVIPVLYDDKCTIKYIPLEEEYEEEEYNPPYCLTCGGSGEGPADGTRCTSCKGSGVELETNKYQDDEDY
jgi:hypothetical protein